MNECSGGEISCTSRVSRPKPVRRCLLRARVAAACVVRSDATPHNGPDPAPSRLAQTSVCHAPHHEDAALSPIPTDPAPLSSVADPGLADDAGYSIAWGCCGHVFHLDCISRWLKTRSVCPLCNREWEFAKIEKIATYGNLD